MYGRRTLWLAAAVVAVGTVGGILPALPHGDQPATQGTTEEHHAGGHDDGHMDGHGGGHMDGHMPQGLEQMREMHRQHQHQHDFAMIQRLSSEERERLFGLMQEIGVALPPMDPARGRRLFVEKGCVVCHSVNGVGGELGPPLNAGEMPRPMNAFEFAARMWRGAPAMTALQQQMLGDVISLDGQDLADLVAFAHDEDEQAKLDESDIPPEYRELIEGE